MNTFIGLPIHILHIDLVTDRRFRLAYTGEQVEEIFDNGNPERYKKKGIFKWIWILIYYKLGYCLPFV